MSDKPSANDPKNLWQNQETEEITMSPREMRERLRRLHIRGRVGSLVMIGVFAAIAIGYGFEAVATADLFRRVGCVLISGGFFCWVAFSMMALLSRPAEAIPEAPSLDIYQNTLQRSLARLRAGNRRGLLGAIPIVVGVGMLVIFPAKQPVPTSAAETGLKDLLLNIGAPPWLVAWMPFLALLSLWGFLMIYLRICSRTWLRSEIHRVDQMRNQDRK